MVFGFFFNFFARKNFWKCANLTLHVLFNALLAPLHGFAFWFDVEFNGPVRQKSRKQANQSLDGNTQNASPSSKKKKPDVSIVLSTAPEDAPTHWQQVMFCILPAFLLFDIFEGPQC
jgi:hypothetical protein